MSYGCACISTTIATAYDTLGEAGLAHSINEPECIGIFTNEDLLPTLLRVLPNTPSLKFVIYDGTPKTDVLDKIRGVRNGIQVLSIDELRALGKAQSADIVKDRKPTPETLACIMYTSGSTGNPKGVCISHANMVASVGGVFKLVGHHLTAEDTYLAYLPLAHILEFLVEMSMFFVGMTAGFGRVKTLTDASVRNCKGDITSFRPSVMVGVPAVWETIRKGIVGKINAGGAVTKSVFNASIKVKKAGIPILTQVVDSVVLAKVMAATGGRLRIGLSGGAALSRETQQFLTLALVAMVQGNVVLSLFRIPHSQNVLTRLWHDRVKWLLRHSPPGIIAIRLRRTAGAIYRSQAHRRSRGRIHLLKFPSSGRSLHPWTGCHEGLLQERRSEQRRDYLHQGRLA